MDADTFQELMQHFRAAVFATSETEMREKWQLVMQVLLVIPLHISCDQDRCKKSQLVSLCMLPAVRRSQ